MVRPLDGSTKVVHFEEAANRGLRQEASILSGIYDLQEVRGVPQGSPTNSSMQDTCDDASAAQGSCCDAKTNPSQLYLRLHYRLWDMVLASLRSKPSETATWVSTQDDKILPIHVACQSTSCPPNIVEALMEANQQTLEFPTNKGGALPLHLLCANDHYIGHDEGIVLKIAQAYPMALHRTNQDGETPIRVLEKHLCSSSVPNQCRRLLLQLERMTETPISSTLHRPRIHEVTPPNRTHETIHSLPSNDASDDGFASRLNKMALMVQDDEPNSTSISYRPSLSLDSMVNIQPAKPVTDEDEREYHSPSLIRANDGGVQFREDSMVFDESSFSEDDLPQHLTPRSVSQVKLKLAKASKENALLRQKLSQLTQTNTSLQSNHENQCKLINDLQQSVENERDLCKSQVKDYEMKLARMHDQLMDSQRQLENKTLNEQKLAHRISHLESSVAGKKADVSTLKAAMQEVEIKNETTQEELELQQSENQRLKHEVSSHIKDKERLMMKLEEVTQEVATYKEIVNVNQRQLKERSAELEQKEIQCRALTESLGIIEKKTEKLEKLNSSLKVKAMDLVDALNGNTSKYKATIANLESSLKKKEEEELDTLKKCEELKRVFKAKDDMLEQLKSERGALEASCELLRKKEIVAQDIANQLAAVTVDRDQFRTQLEAKDDEIHRLSGEIRGLQVESAQKTGIIDETDRRMQALYTELVAQRQRETDLGEQNLQRSRNLERLAHEDENKGIKLRVLKTAVDSYKREMERLVVQKAADDSMAAEKDEKLTELGEQLQSALRDLAELTTKLKEVDQLEKKATESAQEYKEKADETASQLETGRNEIDRARRELQEERSSRHNVSEALAKLEVEHRELQLRQQGIDHDLAQLQVLCAQKSKAEEELRTECTNVRKYNRLQASLIEDLEMNIAEMRSKHAARCEEHEQIRRIAEKRTAFNKSKLQENDSMTIIALRDEIKLLQEMISTMREDALLSEEAIMALKKGNAELQAEIKVSRNDNPTIGIHGAFEYLTLINCGNLLQIKILSEQGEKDQAKWCSENAALQQRILELNGQLSNARKNYEDLCDELEENTGNATEIKEDGEAINVDQTTKSKSVGRGRVFNSPFKSNDERISELKREMRKQFESSRDKERMHNNCLKEYEMRASSLEQEVKKQTLLHSDEVRNQREAYEEKILLLQDKVKAYETKIEILESTISELRSTIDEQKAVMATTTATSEELSEERRLLKATVDALTEELLHSQEMNSQLPSLTEDLKAYQVREETHTLTISSLERCLADVKKDAEVQRKENKRYKELIKMHEEATSSNRSSLEQARTELETLRIEAKESDNLHKKSEESTLLTLGALKTALTDTQRALEEQRDEMQRCDELNKTYQIEVGRLLKLNMSLRDECQEARSKLCEQTDRVEELLKYKNDYEKHSVESSTKLLDILSKFSPDHVVSDLMEENEQLQRDHEKLAEDNVANSANVKYLMRSIQLLETHVMDLTSTHKLLLEETERMRQTITDQELKIAELGDLSDRLVAFNEVQTEIEGYTTPAGSVKLLELDAQISYALDQYEGAFSDHDTTTTSTSNSPADDRAALREVLRQRVTEAFKTKSSKLEELQRQMTMTAQKISEYELKVKEVTSWNQTLKLENKILKTAGKERDDRANKARAALKEENENLKQAIAKLTQQTAEHQYKIRKLAAKQASLQRKKEAAKLSEGTGKIVKTAAVASATSHEDMKLGSIAGSSASEDMGSLAFSADSQDVVDENTSSAMAPESIANTASSDRSVEVVLVEDSRDEQ
ncbi:hypothetical protein MHU86_1617 [Fragilaria crotonensis]|nr:hypothetical protein MHU86_1617 [Fragilaria crotonensis]